jgi:phage terminase Nu1 subunit (DNA packaging protein)
MEKQILNKTDVAEFFGVDRRTIHSWAKQGFGPKFKKLPGGREVTTRRSCDEFLAELSQ